MGRSAKDPSSSSSVPGSYVRSEKWRELRQNLDRVALPRAQWKPNSPGLDEIQRAKEVDEDWEGYYKWLGKKLDEAKGSKDVQVENYIKNRNRQNELIYYAKPYHLNIVTDDLKYQLWLDDVPTGHRSRVDIERYLVDAASSPEAVIKGYIDQMRRDLERKLNMEPKVNSVLVHELEEYAKPFALDVTIQFSAVDMNTAVSLSLKNVPAYGYRNTTVVIPDTMTGAGSVESMLKAHIDKMRTELGWKREEDGMPIQPAQQKPFVLECPDHGGQMVPAEEDVLICLVPGCRKRARRKYKNFTSGTFGG